MTSRLTFSSRRTTPMAITLQSPNEIEVLIHCHCTPGPHPRAHAPAVQYALNKLAECGAIEPRAEGWRTTALGTAWLCALQRVPLPRSVYVDSDGRPLGEA